MRSINTIGSIITILLLTIQTAAELDRRLKYTGDIWDFEGTNSSEQVIYGHDAFGNFGISVSIWGNRMIIGAIGDHESHGAAYLYERSAAGATDWELTAQLFLEKGREGDQFGYAVSIYQTTIVVGANLHDGAGEDAGSAYIYEYQEHHDQHVQALRGGVHLTEGPEDEHNQNNNQWVMVLEMVPEDSHGQDYFGSSVGVYGNTTIIGCWGCDPMGSFSGAAYVYSKYYVFDDEGLHYHSYWGYHQKLFPASGQRYDWFGVSVAIHGYGIVVGSSGRDDPTSSITRVGAAYVYTSTVDDSYADGLNWKLFAELFAGDGEHGDGFGSSVSIFDEIVLVGAPKSNCGAFESGAAYMFKRGDDKDWYFLEKLLPPHPSPQGHYGYSVDVYSDIAVVGSYNATGSGSVYVYGEESDTVDPTKTYWQQAFVLAPENEIPGDKFGYSVAVDDTTVAVGAHGASSEWEQVNDDGTDAVEGPPKPDLYMNGAVHVYWGGNRVSIRSKDVHTTRRGISKGGVVVLSLCGLVLSGYIVFAFASSRVKKDQENQQATQAPTLSGATDTQLSSSPFQHVVANVVNGVKNGISLLTSVSHGHSQSEGEEYCSAPDDSQHSSAMPSTGIDVSVRSSDATPEETEKDEAMRALDESLSKLCTRRYSVDPFSHPAASSKSLLHKSLPGTENSETNSHNNHDTALITDSRMEHRENDDSDRSSS
mmetsp:Transcript_22518/g.32892  ORF Transcript_22518/g.32892 Transcript_22518/m.32892 type:complete len:707 (-) Transcript_22518:95-2215(-)|eukprot:CAMPEP_0185040556 /NCGR_PEP_ID=MMETSP1103-20130426/38774_1 /TAXON_ID=36769 /ORGANISM="Paraphysomonas bandaiensis, Strain Caron Lab Isolate" /LENGTH=706 /DNA_ID=CAMNT_0027579917 /DNA_START=128 /DNA_END=2248 /DNA_ORIENTATION=-